MRSGWRCCRSTGTLWMAFGLWCFLLFMFWAARTPGRWVPRFRWRERREWDGRDRRDTRSGTDARPLATNRHGPTSCGDGVADGAVSGDFIDACRNGDPLGDQFAGVGHRTAGDRRV